MMKTEERFPSDERRQIYYGWREYPLAFRATFFLGFFAGQALIMFIYAVTR